MLRPLLKEMGHSQQRVLSGCQGGDSRDSRRPSAEALHRVWPPLLSLVGPVSPWAGVTSIQGPSLSSFQYREIVLRILPQENRQRAQTLPGGSGGPSVSTGEPLTSGQGEPHRVQPSPPVSTKAPAPCHSLWPGSTPLFPLSQGLQDPGESTGLKLHRRLQSRAVQTVPGV